MKKTIICLLFVLGFSLHAITGEEILNKMDGNREYKSIEATAIMEIHSADEVRVKKMNIKAIGDDKSVTEFINPEDKGVKYLKLKDELWIYFPDEEDTVKISGHMLKEGMMGSDISYEDALESDTLSKKYKIEMKSEETYKGRECYVVELNAIVRDAPYAKRVMYVDKEIFVCWKEEMYAKSGKLLKESFLKKTKKIGARFFAVESEIVNKVRKDSKTVFKMENINLDAKIDESIFSMRYLTR